MRFRAGNNIYRTIELLFQRCLKINYYNSSSFTEYICKNMLAYSKRQRAVAC